MVVAIGWSLCSFGLIKQIKLEEEETEFNAFSDFAGPGIHIMFPSTC